MEGPYHKEKTIVYFSLFPTTRVRQKLHPEAQNSNVLSTSESQESKTKQKE